VSTLDELLSLGGLNVDEAQELLGESAGPTPIAGYQAMQDVEAISSKQRGLMFIVRDGSVVLVYAGPTAVEGIRPDELSERFGTGTPLRSRQGRMATLHVVADRGVAWSEENYELGFVELFPPTTIDAYKTEVYLEPPAVNQ